MLSCTACGSGDSGEQGSTEDIIKTQINGHNLERDSSWVRVVISLVSGAALESKQCKYYITTDIGGQKEEQRVVDR